MNRKTKRKLYAIDIVGVVCFLAWHIYALMAPFASLEKQTETLFWLIYYEKKTLFRLKQRAEKDGL